MGEPNDNIAEENSWTCFECQASGSNKENNILFYFLN
jgi:hypothetical protein